MNKTEFLERNSLVLCPTDMDKENSMETILQLFDLHQTLPEQEHIRMLVNSNGGEVHSALAIIDAIEQIKKTRVVEINGIGNVSSMANYILMSGTKGFRKAYPNTAFLVHDIQWEISGSCKTFELATSSLKVDKEIIKNIILNHSSGKLLEYIEADHDFWFTAQDMVNFGVIDSIV